LAYAQLTSDFFMGKIVDIPKHYDHAHLVGKPCERLDKATTILKCPCNRLRVRVGSRLCELKIVFQHGVGASPPLGHQRHRAVHRYAMQPCSEAGIASELAQGAKSTQVGVLERVTSVMLVAHKM
jgi:hypothetical protein